MMRLDRLALARGTLDRAAARRLDERWLADAWADPRTRVLVVDRGRALVRFHDQGPRAGSSPAGHGGAELVLLSPAEAGAGSRILLGVDGDGVAYFAVLG